MTFPTVICIHFFYFWIFSKNFKTHDLPTSIIPYSIRFGRVVKICYQDQSLQTHACWDYFHGKLVILEIGFSQVFISNVIPKTNTKVWHGCWWDVAIEISTLSAKLKKMYANYHLYECVTFSEFSRHFFTWSWISI